VGEEGEKQLLVGANALGTGYGGSEGVGDFQVAAVSELAFFEVGPQSSVGLRSGA